MVFTVPHKLVSRRLFGLIWVMFFVFLFSWAGYYLIFKAIYNLKPYEKLTFFVESYSVLPHRPEAFKYLLDNEKLKEEGLIDIEYYSYDIFGEETPTAKAVVKNMDFMILPDTTLAAYTGQRDDFYKIEDIMEVPSQYEIGYEGLGIKIYDSKNLAYNDSFTFSDWISFSKDQYTCSFYLLMSKHSSNFDKENNHVLGYTSLDLFLNYNLEK